MRWLLPVIIFVVAVSGCTQQKCGIENCHGLDITCGSDVPDACTEIYMIGDAVMPRSLHNAIHEGYKIGIRI